jgi:hypothetical protein
LISRPAEKDLAGLLLFFPSIFGAKPVLSKAAILAADDRPFETIEVPEWGGSVGIRTITGAERDRWETAFNRDPGANTRARLAVLCIVDDRGERLFDESDIPALGAKSGIALDRVFDECLRINKLRKTDVEATAKN